VNYKIISQEDIVEMHLKKVSLFNTYIVIYYPAESMMTLDDINVAFGYKIRNEDLHDGHLVIIQGEDSDLMRQRINQLVKKFQTVAIEIWSDGQKKYTGKRR
jgi:hypothetical protein